MAKKRKASKSSYFREQFQRHPEWATAPSNKELMDQWKLDHPGKPMTESYKQAMANVKSSLRHKGRGGKKRGRQLLQRAQRSGNTNLVALEIRIDDCLSMARQMDPAGLEDIINHLRRARNEVVLKSGQA